MTWLLLTGPFWGLLSWLPVILLIRLLTGKPHAQIPNQPSN